MEKWKTRSIANNYKKLAHWNLPIESYERWLLRLFYLGWIVTFKGYLGTIIPLFGEIYSDNITLEKWTKFYWYDNTKKIK